MADSSGTTVTGGEPRHGTRRGRDYKWIALSNTTLGVLMSMIDTTIVLIALPAIFRGIRLDPLKPANSSFLLWMILGPLVSAAVLVVSLGRLGDIYGRVRMYNLGFAVFTFFSIMLAACWMTGPAGALWLVVMRFGQGVGGAMLFANSAAILTDAFPPSQRGLALGINGVVGISGSFIGLVLGGLLAPISWRLVFLVSVPVGLFGTVWAYRKLRETPRRIQARIDWWGNLTFALGLVAILIGTTYAIQPYGRHSTGWSSPFVISMLAGGTALLVLFVWVEHWAREPMFRLELCRIRAFTAANVATGASAMARGGLQFTLIIWLQGIWLPLHGYDYARTPLWAAIFMLPLVAGFLIAGPLSGYLSDRHGARPFATGGMVVATVAFAILLVMPIDFSYPWFALVVFLDGVGMGLFSSPNRAAAMNSLPTRDRGVGGGMNLQFLNTASVLSVGVFFSLMIVGLASHLPSALERGLVSHGVPRAEAVDVAHLPPVATLFASFLGYNPVRQLIGARELAAVPAPARRLLTGRTFFPRVVASSFHHALELAFGFAILACLISALASLMRGGIYHADETG